jgi:hypothetical protein
MKFWLIILFFFTAITASAQTSVHRYDRVIFSPALGKDSIGFQIMSSTRNRTGAFWRNTGQGWGEWAYSIDSVWTVGDSVRFRRGAGYIALKMSTSGGGTAWGTITGTLSSQTDLQTALNAKLNISDTATMLATYAHKTFSSTLTDAATVVWNYAATAGPTVTIAGNRALSLTNLPSTANIVAYGCITVIQDATGGRTLSPPANSRGVGGMNLSGGSNFPLTTTANARDKLCFEYKQAENIIYWAIGKNAN